MSNVEIFNAAQTDSLVRKVKAKLEALESYVRGEAIQFTVPDKKMSLNWFCNLNEAGLERLSKSAKNMQPGSELRILVDKHLDDANKHRSRQSAKENGKRGSSEAIKQKNKSLVQEVDALKAMLNRQIDENVELRRRLKDAENLIGLEQATWRDKRIASITS